MFRSIESYLPSDDPKTTAAIDDILARAKKNNVTLTRDEVAYVLCQEHEIRTLQSLINLILTGKVKARLGERGELFKPGDYSFSIMEGEDDTDPNF